VIQRDPGEILFREIREPLVRPVPDPVLEKPQVLLLLRFVLAEIPVHVPGLSVLCALAVIETAHERARVRPAGEEDEMGVTVHLRALELLNELLLVLLEVAVLRRVPAMAARALPIEHRLDLRSVPHFVSRCRGPNDDVQHRTDQQPTPLSFHSHLLSLALPGSA
jgi:hypothetical protein